MSVVRRAAFLAVLAASASMPAFAVTGTVRCRTGDATTAETIASRIDALILAGRMHEDEAGDCVARLGALAAADPLLGNRVNVAIARREFTVGHVDAAREKAEAVLAATPLADADAVDANLLLAEIEVTRSEWAKGQKRLEALLARPAGSLSAHDEWAAATLRAKALIFQRKPDARATAEAAHAAAERRFGAKSQYASLALLEVGVAARVAADYGGAIEIIERMFALENTQAMPNRLQQARALVMLAQTRKIAGDLKRAEADYETALAFMREHPEPVPIHLSAALGGIANLHRDTNRVELSLASYERASPVYRRAFGDVSNQTASVLNNYGVALGKLKRYDDAVRVYQEAIDIAEKLGLSDDPGMAMPRGNIALVYLWKKDYVAAEAGFRSLLERTANQPPGSETDSTYSRLGVAASLWGQGHAEDAFAEAERAERERQLGLSLAMTRMSETGAIGFQEIQRPSLELMVAIAYATGDPKQIERTWEVALLARGQVTQQVAARLALGRTAGDGAAATAFETWRAASAKLTELRLANLVASTPVPLRDAEDALDRAERALGAITASTAAALPRERTPIATLRAALPKGASLVSYVEANVRTPDEYAHDEVERRPRDVYAFVARGDAPVRLVRLADSDVIARDVGRWRALAGRPDSAEGDVTSIAQQLRRRVVDPLGLPARDARIFVVPGGELHRLNFSALANDDGGVLLEDGLQFHLLNHEHELTNAPPASNAAALHVFALSDPAFAGASAALTRGCGNEPGLPALPGTRREVESLRGLLPADAVLTALDGEAATESAVRRALPGNDILHLATHALRVDGLCVARTRAAGFAKRAPTAAATEPVPGALVLANDAAGGDGLLTETEVSALDLDRVRWAVLSACDSGLGDSRYYEGAFGLRRAFLLAGARTVIMSLWRIDDASTAEWMKALYQARLKDGRDTPDAVAAAQRAMLQQRRERGLSLHPYYWAAFVASGDWR